MRVVAAFLWAVLLVVGWACPLMADCFESLDHAAESCCRRSSDESQGNLPEDCPYQIHKTSPAEGKFEPEAGTALRSADAAVTPATWVPAEQITPLVPPVVDDDYFDKLTVLLV